MFWACFVAKPSQFVMLLYVNYLHDSFAGYNNHNLLFSVKSTCHQPSLVIFLPSTSPFSTTDYLLPLALQGPPTSFFVYRARWQDSRFPQPLLSSFLHFFPCIHSYLIPNASCDSLHFRPKSDWNTCTRSL